MFSLILNDPKSISFLISLTFIVFTFGFGLKKFGKWDIKIIAYMVIAWFLGSTIYPALSIIFYSYTGETLLKESINEYREFLGLSGVLLILTAGLTIFEMLRANKKRKKKKK